jgi:ligand-binding sensor domain-containing protein
MLKLWFAFIGISFSGYGLLFAQNPTLYNYTTTDGLPSSECYDIIQDSQGYVWISTDRGVCRFDGYEFTNYTTREGLVDNTVLNLYEDVSGKIWFLSISGNLCYFKNGVITPYRYNHVLTSKRKFIIRSFYSDAHENITMGTLGRGIIEIDSVGSLNEYAANIGVQTVFIQSRNGHYMYGLLGGAGRFEDVDSLRLEVDYFDLQVSCTVERLGTSTNLSGVVRRNGTIVAHFPGYYFSGKHGDWKLIPEKNRIIRVYEDPDSCLWVSDVSGGVKRYPPNRDNFSDEFDLFLENESVTSVLCDAEGGTWISTLSSGIYYSPSLHFRTFRLPEKYGVTDLACQPGSRVVLAACTNGIVKSYSAQGEGKTYNFNSKAGDSTNYIYSLLIYRDTVFVSGGYETCVYAGGKKKVIKNEGYIRNALLHNGGVIGCSNHKLLAYRMSGTGSVLIRWLPVRTENMYVDRAGKIWIGDYTGLYHMEDTTLIKSYPDDPLFSTRVSAIGETASGIMAVSTIGAGLILVKDSLVFTIDRRDGLLSDVINCQLIRGNEIWLGTNRGISLVTIPPDGHVTIENFTEQKGLPGIEINNILACENNIWASTKKLVFYFDPEAVRKNNKAPEIYLREIVAAGEKVAAGSRQFAFNQFPVRINFTGLAFKERGDVHYRYRLKGLHQLWRYTSARFVEYSSLPAGDFVFEVAARNEDGVWSDRPAIYSFAVIPPFWRTTAFMVICAISGLVLVSAIFYLRIKRIRKKNKMESDILNYRQQALAGQINPHFLDNALNSIQAFMMTGDKRSASKYLSSFSSLMRKSLDHSRKEMVPLADEIMLIRTYLQLEKLRFNNKFDFELFMEEDMNEHEICIPSMIIQPHIENAILHGINESSRADLIITISFRLRNGVLEVQVKDNGIGIDQSLVGKKNKIAAKTSAGSLITTERLKVLCKSFRQPFYFEITDLQKIPGQGTGTLVKFNLPFNIQTYADKSDHN